MRPTRVEKAEVVPDVGLVKTGLPITLRLSMVTTCLIKHLLVIDIVEIGYQFSDEEKAFRARSRSRSYVWAGFERDPFRGGGVG